MLSANTRNGISWYASNTVAIPHGMFARTGGTSLGKYDSFNLSFGVGDERTTVQENRDLLKQVLDLTRLISSQQIHGDTVVVVEQIDGDLEYTGYDALITNQPGTGLLIQQADCQAVLLYDPNKQVIAAVHNGWRGSVADIITKTIKSMRQHFGVRPSDICAVISPSLGPCCAEFINAQQELPTQFHSFRTTENHFDFWAISRWQLQQTGIDNNNIEVAEICTCCNKDFFSYRRARKNGNRITGRNGSVIVLP